MGQRRPASHVHAPAPQDPWLGLSWSWSDTLVVLGFSAGALLGVVSESALVPRGGTDRPVAGAQEGDRERRDRGGSGASRKSSGPCRGSELSLTSPTRLRSSTRELRNYGVHPALVRDDLERLFPEEECGLLTLRTHTCLVRRVAYRGGRVNGRARVCRRWVRHLARTPRAGASEQLPQARRRRGCRGQRPEVPRARDRARRALGYRSSSDPENRCVHQP